MLNMNMVLIIMRTIHNNTMELKTSYYKRNTCNGLTSSLTPNFRGPAIGAPTVVEGWCGLVRWPICTPPLCIRFITTPKTYYGVKARVWSEQHITHYSPNQLYGRLSVSMTIMHTMTDSLAYPCNLPNVAGHTFTLQQLRFMWACKTRWDAMG